MEKNPAVNNIMRMHFDDDGVFRQYDLTREKFDFIFDDIINDDFDYEKLKIILFELFTEQKGLIETKSSIDHLFEMKIRMDMGI